MTSSFSVVQSPPKRWPLSVIEPLGSEYRSALRRQPTAWCSLHAKDCRFSPLSPFLSAQAALTSFAHLWDKAALCRCTAPAHVVVASGPSLRWRRFVRAVTIA
jgi:hypothetical protein